MQRRRRGRAFSYHAADGTLVHEAAELARIKALAIPPAWREVWICPKASGHIQAVGTDAAGRRQYLYHPDFRARREEAKHAHVLDVVAPALPRLRRRVGRDLALKGLRPERVLACATRLLDLGFFRSGSTLYERENGSYGLTTLLREQVDVRGAAVRFAYPAKSGRRRELVLTDADTAAVVRALLGRRDPSPQLFGYWQAPQWCPVDGALLNAYLRDAADADLSAKDFRTWHATVLAAVGLAASWPVAERSASERRRAAARVVRETSEYLGNTPAVCRASYINPKLFELFDQGLTIAPSLPQLGAGAGGTGLPGIGNRVERAVVDLLGGAAARTRPGE
ncbi:DNA topoisomerase IB [Kitasatospora sp. NPDC101801]|uniref:DNA topoisomerase IB n=1 Tax=Kitasatospora sp. NPDC101801 TaxID=3364103 RepID=UPI0038086B81